MRAMQRYGESVFNQMDNTNKKYLMFMILDIDLTHALADCK